LTENRFWSSILKDKFHQQYTLAAIDDIIARKLWENKENSDTPKSDQL